MNKRLVVQPRRVAICFDLDGVLINTMPLHAKAWQDALKRRHLHVARRWIYEHEGEPGIVSARALLSSSGRESSHENIRALLSEKERRFTLLARHIRVDQQLVQLMTRLAYRGVCLGLVTGTSSSEVNRIVPKETLRLFDVVVTGDRVKLGKPHPEPYRFAFHQLNVKARDTIVVENAPYGIEAARKAGAGLVVALTSSLPGRFLRRAHMIVSSIKELCLFLEGQIGLVDKDIVPSIQ